MSKKKLYHGTTKCAAKNIIKNGIDISFSNKPVDFGSGFYLADNKMLIAKWALQKAAIENDTPAILTFEADFTGLKVVELERDLNWARIIHAYRIRLGWSEHNDVDVIIGPIADGATMREVRRYERSKKSLEDLNILFAALTRRNYDIQYVIKSAEAVNRLNIIDKEGV